jgi:hypothetical protein
MLHMIARTTFESFASTARAVTFGLLGTVMMITTVPAAAQVQSIDPDKAIDADLLHSSAVLTPQLSRPLQADQAIAVVPPSPASLPLSQAGVVRPVDLAQPEIPSISTPPNTTDTTSATFVVSAASQPDAVYQQAELVSAAEGVFGKGAHGLAKMIEDVLKKQGRPNAYIVGYEGGGAMIAGLRYGSGTLFHKVERRHPVYWTGPSFGFDVGANGGDAFILVYNLQNTDDLFQRFASAEGQAYVLGGFNASYLRHGDVVLIPVRMGVGLRLGLNTGYLKFSKKAKWSPF